MADSKTGSPEDIVGAEIGGNSRQAEAALPFLEKIQEEQIKIDEINKKAKTDCLPHKKAQAQIKKEMQEATGVVLKAANAWIAKNTADRRFKEKVEAMDENTAHDFKVLWDGSGQAAFDIDAALPQ